LVNRYNDGNDYLGAHSDSKDGLDKGSIVAGISYGKGVRKFRIRNRKTKKIVIDYDHHAKTLIVMDGNFQNEFTHEIPKQKKIKDPRISLKRRIHKN